MSLKADAADFHGRFREIVSDPINLLIKRHPLAGVVEDDHVYLHNGNRVALSGPYAYYADFSKILVINRGVHEPLEEFVFQEVLKTLPEASIMLELGAYWGHYSMWLKRVHPTSLVYLIEPDESNLQVGRYNFQQNNYNGEFIQSFVGHGQFEVDAFMKSKHISKLDILHSDIQGFEIEMLDGVSEALQNKSVSHVFISTHSQEIHEQVLEKMTSFGYRVEVSSNFDTDTTSFDGFVYASSPGMDAVFVDFQVFGREQILESEPGEILNGLIRIRASCEMRSG